MIDSDGLLASDGTLADQRVRRSAAPAGPIGAAAASGQTIKVSDMSRVRRFGEAISLETEARENATRIVAFPQLPGALSQIAVPMTSHGVVVGVVFIEGPERLAIANRMPEIKDNLETRLLLPRRRLDEKQAPIRLVRVGRGRVRLDIEGTLLLRPSGE